MTFVRNVIVLSLRAEMPRLGQTGFTKKIECSVNSCQADVGILFGQQTIHLLCGDMFDFQKRAQYLLTLTGELELMLAQMFFENTDLFYVFAHFGCPLD